ncbi:VOC family protein [Streptomyces mangrovi]|uniref:VOC family protein n=1 Tax=Streptomyces mangrovi TaxID=1206892 RepID=UPI00399CC251
MAVDLFADIRADDCAAALDGDERLLGPRRRSSRARRRPYGNWRSTARCSFIERRPEHAGHALHAVFVDDLDALVTGITARGLEPVNRETCPDGARKVTYRDPEGNEIGFGGAPA